MTGLLDLPDELLVHIISFLPVSAHFNFAISCRVCAACSREWLRRHQACAREFGAITGPEPRAIMALLRTVLADDIAAWNVRSFTIWPRLLDPRWATAYPRLPTEPPSLPPCFSEEEQAELHELAMTHLLQPWHWDRNITTEYVEYEDFAEVFGADMYITAARTLLLALCPRLSTLTLMMSGLSHYSNDYSLGLLKSAIFNAYKGSDACWPPGFHALRELEINVMPQDEKPGSGVSVTPHTIAVLMLLPALECLYVHDLQGDEPSLQQWLDVPTAHCSLKHLILSEPGCRAKVLSYILGRIKALRSFTLHGWSTSLLPPQPWMRQQQNPLLSPEQALECLREHQPGLEEFCLRRKPGRRVSKIAIKGWADQPLTQLGTPADLVYFPELMHPHDKPRFVTVNIAHVAAALSSVPEVRAAVDQMSEAFINNLPPTIEVLKLVDVKDIMGFGAADLDDAFTAFLQARRYPQLRVLDFSGLRTPLCWQLDFLSAPALAAELGIKLFVPGQLRVLADLDSLASGSDEIMAGE